MYRITCTTKKTGEVLYYTTRSGRHDVGPKIAAHEFRDGAVAQLRAEEMRGWMSFNLDFDMAVESYDQGHDPDPSYESYLNGRDRF